MWCGCVWLPNWRILWVSTGRLHALSCSISFLSSRSYLHFQTLKLLHKPGPTLEGKARSGAQQPAIVLQSYIWPDAQSRRLIWISKFLKPGAEPICESSILKWDLLILCKFALGLRALIYDDWLFERSRVWSKKVENCRV